MLNAEVRTVHKNVFLDRVTVKIDVEVKTLFVGRFQLPRQLHQMVSLGKGVFARLVERSVQIFAEQTGPVISCHYSIRVNHRYHHENVVLSQFPSLVTAHILQKPLGNKGRIGLSGVYPCSYEYNLFIILWFCLIGDF